MEKLKLSSDRKVSQIARYTPSSKTWVPKVKNAFGLPAHVSCPGATQTCKDTCYAFRLEKAYTNVNKLLKHNWDLLYSNRTNGYVMEDLLSEMIEEFRKQHDKVIPDKDKKFRIHWNGDFWSYLYATAWASVVRANPDIQFWAYTRSFLPNFNILPFFKRNHANLPNLSLYLSVDKDNAKYVDKIPQYYLNSVKIAYLGKDWDTAQTEFVQLTNHKAPKCPENTGRYDLVSKDGVGACIQCDLCVEGKNNVLFAINKKV